MRGNGKRIAGRNYVPSCGRCDVLPWELCACSDARLLELNARIVAPARIEKTPVKETQNNVKPGSMAEKINAEADDRLAFALEGQI